MNQDISNILDYIERSKSIHLNGYKSKFLIELLDKRITDTGRKSYQSYLKYLQQNDEEPDKLIHALTIQHSEFFRNPVVYNYLSEKILPSIIQQKITLKEPTIRAWSAGCAHGEEAYSLSILINEIAEKKKADIVPRIFATDIEKSALARAKEAIYHRDTIENIPYGLVEKHFSKEENYFRIKENISRCVSFSLHDLLDKRTSVPPASVFGNFDLVFCRNVLIYFKSHFQELICKKLYSSLALDGFLILGETESIPSNFGNHFISIADHHIFQKQG